MLFYKMPSMFLYGHYNLYKQWLTSMRITFVPMVAMIVATALHLPSCFLFVNYFDLSIKGIMLADLVKNGGLLLAVTIYGNCSAQVRPAVFLPNLESFRGWGEYLSFSLPATIMICAEWWAFEVLVIMAGSLGLAEQVAQVVVFQVGTVMVMVAWGISEVTAGIIGNCIGAQNVQLAKRFISLIAKASLGS